MSENAALIKKLGIKSGNRVLALNVPGEYLEQLLAGVEEKATAPGQYDVVITFAHRKADVDALAKTAIESLKPGGWLWFGYPKKSGKGVSTDIHRDAGWETLREAGWDTVTLVAVDKVWSALRFRPADQINYAPTSTRSKAITK